MKKKRLLIYFCICLALFTLLGISFFYLSKLNALEKYNKRVDHSYQIIIETANLEKNLINAETGQRGFLLTREPFFLESYLAELKNVPEIFSKLDFLTAGNKIQQSNLDTLRQVINLQLNYLKNNLNPLKEDTISIARFHESNVFMNKIKEVIFNIKQNESVLLIDGNTNKERKNQESKASSLISLTISFTLCCAAAIAIIIFFNKGEIVRLDLEDKVHKLKTLNHEVKELTLASTHNLQEPMRKVQLMIDRLLYIKELNREMLVDQINRVKHIYSQQQEINNHIVDYYDILSDHGTPVTVDLNAFLENLSKEHHWGETFRLKLGALGQVEAIPHQLKLLFIHILNNSIRYNHPDRELEIRISEVKGKVEGLTESMKHKRYTSLAISDNGIGVPKEFLHKLFDLFQKLDDGDFHTDDSRHGMGLSFCKRIMLNHDGWISAVQNAPHGLTIVLFFPKK